VTAGRDTLVDTFVAHLRALCRSSVVGDDWLQLDLTTAQLKALFALSLEQPATIGVLAQRLGVGLPAASHIVERLVRLRLVSRYEDAADRRRAYAQLTGEGEALLSRLREGSRERIRAHLTRLTDAQLDELNRLMEMLTAPDPEASARDPLAALL